MAKEKDTKGKEAGGTKEKTLVMVKLSKEFEKKARNYAESGGLDLAWHNWQRAGEEAQHSGDTERLKDWDAGLEDFFGITLKKAEEQPEGVVNNWSVFAENASILGEDEKAEELWNKELKEAEKRALNLAKDGYSEAAKQFLGNAKRAAEVLGDREALDRLEKKWDELEETNSTGSEEYPDLPDFVIKLEEEIKNRGVFLDAETQDLIAKTRAEDRFFGFYEKIKEAIDKVDRLEVEDLGEPRYKKSESDLTHIIKIRNERTIEHLDENIIEKGNNAKIFESLGTGKIGSKDFYNYFISHLKESRPLAREFSKLNMNMAEFESELNKAVQGLSGKGKMTNSYHKSSKLVGQLLELLRQNL
ncbi:hypothetical protein ACFLZC_02600 [Patescibacteria group bacterium]